MTTAPSKRSIVGNTAHTRSSRLAELVKVGLALGAQRNPVQLLEVFCRAAQNICGATYVGVGLLDETGEHLRHFFACGMDAEVLARLGTVAPRAGALGALLESRHAHQAHGLDSDTRTLGLPEAHPPMHSFLGVPIASPARIYGWLYFGEKLGADHFSDDDERIALLLAAQVAMAYENLVLYDEIQQHAARLETEIAERNEHAEKIARLSRVHAVRSGINSLIIRARSRDELFREACRIAVEAGQFRFAWIGVGNDIKTIQPVAFHGVNDGYLDQVRLWLDTDNSQGPGPLQQALREKKPFVCNAIAAYPLLLGDAVVGMIGLFAAEPGCFDEAEQKLLLDLADDISFALEWIAREERLNYLAYYDPLTQLANRTLFLDRLNQYINAARHEKTQLALFVLDLDRFKVVNDTLGRQAGDLLLKGVGARLTQCAGNINFVARVGPDRFAVVFQGLRQAVDVARFLQENVLAYLGLPFDLAGQELRVSAGSGIAVFPGDGEDAETIFRNAETASKRAKRGGERYLFYTPEMTATVSQRLILENRLRRALERDEFVLHYQPKVDLQSGRITGAEALIRWNTPDLGLVQPTEFIALLEETNMIWDVGRWVLRSAAAECRALAAQKLRVPRIAVNVSAVQLQQADFVDAVKAAIWGPGEDRVGEPVLVDLEVTESALIKDSEPTMLKLKALRDMEVNIAIDDFGTGYSSLSYLARLPLNALKIDRSFIIKMTTDPDTMSIVSTTITLAHALNLKVIAEGVDTEEQLKFLRLLKCDEMQGYLFSKPLPAAELAKLLQENRRL